MKSHSTGHAFKLYIVSGSAPHAHGPLHVMPFGCISLIHCFWMISVLCECLDQPNVVWVFGSVQWCVCVACSLELHMAGTWHNNLDIRLSLSFNSEDMVFFCCCFLIWFAIRKLNKYILYGKGFLKARRPPKVSSEMKCANEKMTW